MWRDLTVRLCFLMAQHARLVSTHLTGIAFTSTCEEPVLVARLPGKLMNTEMPPIPRSHFSLGTPYYPPERKWPIL